MELPHIKTHGGLSSLIVIHNLEFICNSKYLSALPSFGWIDTALSGGWNEGRNNEPIHIQFVL